MVCSVCSSLCELERCLSCTNYLWKGAQKSLQWYQVGVGGVGGGGQWRWGSLRNNEKEDALYTFFCTFEFCSFAHITDSKIK